MKAKTQSATHRLTALIAVFVLLVFAQAAFPQAADGNIVGLVSDSSGAVIGKANVEALNTATGVKHSTVTSGDGSYRFNNIPVGKYDISVSATGFTTNTLKGVTVELNKTGTANLSLQVGSVSTQVEVTEAVAVIDTTTAQVSSNFEARQAMDLGASSNGSNGVLNLSLLSAGVASSGGVGYGTGPSVGGQRPTNNNFVIEGIDNNRRDVTGPVVNISNEAVAQFSVIQNQAAPEIGHSSGGTFNTVIKTGDNEIHGSFYDYLQNRNLNSLDAAFKRQGLSNRERFDYNRLGATIGGPIVKNKLFYFGNFEYNPIGQASAPASEVLAPTAAGFTTLSSIPGVSKTNLAVLQQYVSPAASQSGTTTVAGRTIPIGTLSIVGPNYSNTYNWLASVDYEMSDKDRLRFRTAGNKIDSVDIAAQLPAFWGSIPTRQYLNSLTYFRNFTPNLVNEARLGITRFTQPIPTGDFKFPGLDQFPNIQISEDLNVQLGPNPNGPQTTVLNTYQLVDNVTWIKNKHTFKFGWDSRRVNGPSTFVQRSRGDYQYNTLEDYLLDLYPVFAERSVGISPFSADLMSHYGFLNDDWKIRPNLTLNLGIRYEFVDVPEGNKRQRVNALASVPGLVNFSQPKAQKNNWAPRLGIAWSPGKSGTLSVRAGFGISYDQIYQNLGILSLPPQDQTTVDVEPPDPNISGFLAKGGIGPNASSGTLSVADARALTASYVPDQVRPYSINWNLSVSKVISKDYTFEARYLGTRGVKLPMQIRLNRAAAVQPDRTLPVFMSRPSQTELDSLRLTLNDLQAIPSNIWASQGFLSNVVSFQPVGNSTYHGLALQLTRRFTRDLSFTTSYTWSHAIDDGTAAVFSTVIAPRRVQDFQNLRPERSSSALDRRHRFSQSWIYDVPFMKGSKNWLAKNVVGNWTWTGTYIYESPMYGTVGSNVDSNLNGDSAGDRSYINPAGDPNRGSDATALRNSAGRIVGYLANDPSARYIRALAGVFPNGGRNTLALRPINNFDMSFAKNFNFTERKKFTIRADMFNAFNHSQFLPGFANVVTSRSRTDTRNYLIPGNASFNNPETAFENNARVIQLVARFVF